MCMIMNTTIPVVKQMCGDNEYYGGYQEPRFIMNIKFLDDEENKTGNQE